MNNEIPLSNAEIEIAETCSDKPAQDYSETSFFHSFNADAARTITKKYRTENSRIPEIKQLIIEACKQGSSHLRLEYHLFENELGALKLDGFKVNPIHTALISKEPNKPITFISW